MSNLNLAVLLFTALTKTCKKNKIARKKHKSKYIIKAKFLNVKCVHARLVLTFQTFDVKTKWEGFKRQPKY